MPSESRPPVPNPRFQSVLMTLAYLALLTIADAIITTKVHQDLKTRHGHWTMDWGLVLISTVSGMTVTSYSNPQEDQANQEQISQDSS